MPLDLPPTNPRAATRDAMSVALALAEAAGRADGIADRMTMAWNPPLRNLRYRLLLWAGVTRDERLRHLRAEYRAKARNAVRCYRALQAQGRA